MKKAILLILVLLSMVLLGAQSREFLKLSGDQFTPQVLQQIAARNAGMRDPLQFNYSNLPQNLPTTGDTAFEEGTTWQKNFASAITGYTGGSIFWYWSDSEKLVIEKAAGSETILKFTPRDSNWFGTETIALTIADHALSEEEVGYTWVFNINVTNTTDAPVFNAKFDDTSEGVVFLTPEDTPITIDFRGLAPDGEPWIKCLDSAAGNFLLYITRIGSNVNYTQYAVNGTTQSFSGPIVKFTPRANWSGENSFLLTVRDPMHTAAEINGNPLLMPSRSMKIKVTFINDSPVIESFYTIQDGVNIIPPTPVGGISQGDNLAFGLSASDPDNTFNPSFQTLSYTWSLVDSFGGALAITQPHSNEYTHLFSIPGTFTLTCTVNDGAGEPNSSVSQVWVITVMPEGPLFNPWGGTFSSNVMNSPASAGVILYLPDGVSARPIYFYTTVEPSDIGVGTMGTPDSPVTYGTPIYINIPPEDYSYTITAWYLDDIGNESVRVSQTYIMTGQVLTPVFAADPALLDVASGIYRTNAALQVTLTCATPGAEIYFSRYENANWTVPELYTSPIMINGHLPPNHDYTATLRAYAKKDGWQDSPTTGNLANIFHVRRYVEFPRPVLNVIHGTASGVNTYSVAYGDSVQAVFTELSTTPAEAKVWYRMNGGAVIEYIPGMPLYFTTNTTIELWADYTAPEPDFFPSEVHTYTINVEFRTLMTLWGSGNETVFKPAGGIYTEARSVEINPVTNPPGAQIMYSVNGVAGPFIPYFTGTFIPITQSTTLVAYAEALSPWTNLPSNYETAVYTITGSLPAPTINPPGYPVVYPGDITVTITMPNSVDNAIIYYTTDGNEPTENPSLRYTSSFILPQGHWEVKAKAFKQDWTPSPTATENYYINFLLSVNFSPSDTLHYDPITVGMTSAPGSVIYYTSNGDIPTTSSTVYAPGQPELSLAIVPTGPYTKTYKSIATKIGYPTSELAEITYHMIPTVLNPVFNPIELTHEAAIDSVWITSATDGATIYYTLNGGDPGPDSVPPSLVFTSPFPLNSTTTVRARAYKGGFRPSEIITMDYTIGNSIGAIVFQPAGGTYNTPQDVSLLTIPANAVIYYTTDGSIPVPGNPVTTLFTAPIHLNNDTITTIKAIAILSGWQQSSGEAEYTITGTLAAPVISSVEYPGVYTFTQGTVVPVTIQAPKGNIKYALNGIEQPGFYTAPFNVTTNTTITAWAVLGDWIDSPVTSATYTFNGQLAAPVFSLASGTYFETKEVSIYAYPATAEIYYWLNDADSLLYNAVTPVQITRNSTLRAKAYLTGWLPSAEAVRNYFLKVNSPVLSLPSGDYAGTQTITMSAATDGATIYYTTGSSVFSVDNWTQYSGSININGSATIKAIAIKLDWTNSEIVTYVYNLNGSVANISILPTGGTYYDQFDAVLSTTTPSAIIRFTTDGTAPDIDSQVYTAAIPITEITTLRARAYRDNWLPSAEASVHYDLKVKPVTADITPGIYNNAQTVHLSTLTNTAATIRYTVDGTLPNIGSPVFPDAGYLFDTTTRIRAIAYRNDGLDWLPSNELDATYVITQQVATPTFSPTGGVYHTYQTVTINCAAPYDTLWYSLDGGEWQVYVTPLEITETTTIYAKASKVGWQTSPEVYANYVILLYTVETPIFAEEPGFSIPGTYNNAVNVKIITSTPGALIYYTTDGSEPTELPALLYTDTFPISVTTTVKARAFNAPMIPSAILSGTYRIEPLTVLSPLVVPVSDVNPFYEPFNVYMSPRTIDSVIRYTTDGTEPTESDQEFTSLLLSATGTHTIIAKAFKNGFASESVRRDYRITGKVNISGVTITPDAGNYTTLQTISTVGALNPIDAVLRYTTDGSIPSITSPPFVNLNPLLDSTLNLKIRGFKEDWLPSDVIGAYYTFTGKVQLATDLFSLDTAPIYTSPQTLTLNTATTPPNATLRYTLNGDDPDQNSPAYLFGQLIPITATTTVKVKGFYSRWDASDIASATYLFTGQVVLGSISPEVLTHQNTQTVMLGLPTPNDAEVYYTKDGSTPVRYVSPLYNSATNFTVDANEVIDGSPNVTIKVKGFKNTWDDSTVQSRTYTFQTATPQFNRPSGVFPASQWLKLSCFTNGATIRYTTGTSEPTLASPIFPDSLFISESITVNARAFNGDYLPSPIASATYVIGSNQLVALPTFTPVGGTYPTVQNVRINCSTPGATIYYRTDDIDPTEVDTPFTELSPPINVGLNSTLTIRAKAFKEGLIASQVVTATYFVNDKVAAVAYNPVGGTYTSAQQVVLTSATEGAYILYTTDGGEPDSLYTNSIYVPFNSTKTITARAYKEFWETSDPASATYTITNSTYFAQPMLTPAPGTLTNAQDVTISQPYPASAEVWYTLDGTDPLTSPTAIRYNSLIPIHIDGGIGPNNQINIQVAAKEDGWNNQVFGNNIYTFNAEMPAYAPTPGYYADPTNVSITSGTISSTIYYTINGANPTTASDVYDGQILISNDTTFRAFAWKAGYNSSPIVAGIYGIGGVPMATVSAPIFDPIAGTYPTARTVSIISATPGATIRYSLNGDIPTSTFGEVYGAQIPLALDTYTMIRAIAYMEDGSSYPSPVVTSEYTITGQVADVVFTPPAGTYATPQTVFLSCATTGVYFRYTLDGTEPNDLSPLYNTNGIYVSQNTVINAKAYRIGWTSSALATAVYNIRAVSFDLTPLAASYINAQTVYVSNLNPANANVVYSIDGSDPSIPYTSDGINLNGGVTDNGIRNLRVRATLDTWAPAEVSQNYIFYTSVPTFTPPAGAYTEAKSVTLGSATIDAVVRYTTNGDIPSETIGEVYNNIPINVSQNMTIRAYAYKPGYTTSTVVSATYAIGIVTPVVANPVFNPGTSSSNLPISVNLSTTTADATIYYTTNGDDPTELSTPFSQPIVIPYNTNVFIKARAYRENWIPSAIVSANYVVTGTVADVSFLPMGGIYPTVQNVQLTTLTEGAIIHYTTDGTEPNNTSSPRYLAAIPVPLNTTNMVITAKAFRTGWLPSQATSQTYTVTGQVQLAANVFITNPGIYTTGVNVELNTTTVPSGATLHYTLDGSEPTLSSTPYTVPIAVTSGTVTIRVRGFKENWLPSEVAYATYSVTGQIEIEAPVFSLASGLYHTPQIVSVNSLTNPVGGTIRYTTNGDEPTINSSVYSTPFILPIGSTLNLKVKAFLTGWDASPTYSANYTVNGTVTIPEPVFSLASDTYTTPQIVTINTAIPAGARVYYTTNGDDPDESSTPYTVAINVPLGTPLTLKARAYYTDWITSQVYAAYYNMTGQVVLAGDLFSLDPTPVYTSPQTLTLNTTTIPLGATLRYTLNGDDPTELSPAYVTGRIIPITSTTTVKVIGYLNNWLPSAIASVTYNYTGQVVLGSITPEAGTYQNTQTVVLGIPTPNDATVYYTTNGGDPTTESSPYNNTPFAVDANHIVNGSPDVIVKVRAFKDTWVSSEVLIKTYTFLTGTPQFNPIGGLYTTTQSLILTSGTNAAVIRYTTDGSDPNPTSSVYVTPISITQSMTVKARAYNGDYLPSPITSATYVIGTNQLVELPIFTPPAGTYTTAQNVQINCGTSGATIYYRTDGIDPTESDTPFTTDIVVPLNSSLTIKARAYKEGLISSQVATATYVITNKVAAVAFTPVGGTYTSAQQVVLTTATEGAYILYTTTIGGVPDTPYTSAINVPVNSTLTITAQAFKDGWDASDIETATYTITNSTSFNQPMLVPAPGTYSNSQSVTIASPIPPTAQVWYTLDGSVPSPANPNAFLYTEPFMLDGNANLSVTAIAGGWDNQVYGNNIYTFNAEIPVYTPIPGYYADPINVSILSNTAGAMIHYTMDGSEPNISSPTFVTPVNITADTTFKAIAMKAGYNPSPVISGIYGIGGIVIPTVASPQFDPIAGTYPTARTVSITSTTEGSVIRYTLNGGIPTTTVGEVYSAPIPLALDSYTMIRAIAYMEDGSSFPSPVVTAEYTITGQIADVVFTPPSGTYATPQTVFLSCATTGVYFRYTLDGSEPNDSSSLYNTSGIYIAQNSSVVIKAKAYRQGWTSSTTATGVYNVRGISFSLSPIPGTYNNAQSVSVISLNPANANVVYSIDGSEPTIPYTGGINLNGGLTDNGIRTLRVKATLDTWAPTEVSQDYVFNTTAPSFNPPAGTYDSARLVSLGSSTSDAVIKYTINGDIPSETVGMTYNNIPISVTENMTIRAYAFKPGYITSMVVSATYAIGTVTPVVANPVFNPGTSSSYTPINVSLSTSTVNATIYYTTNGDDPTQLSTPYSQPIVVPYNTNMFIKARAYRESWIPSAIVSANYVVTGTVADVMFLPIGGTYQTAQNVQLTSQTEGAVIYYTTDGTMPNTSSPQYITAIPVPLNTTNMVITAKAFRSGWQNSQPVAQTYTITGQVVINDPVYSPNPGTYTSAQDVVIGTTNPAGAIIRYTTDGTDPTPTSNVYTVGSISLPMAATTTVKVRAYLANWEPSPIYTAVYTVTGQVMLPANMFNPISGTYQTPQTVHLTGNTIPAGALLRYTLNGGEPDVFSPAYDAVSGIAINGSAVLRVKGFLTGWIPSETSTATYTITGQVVFNAPIFSPAGGAYTAAQTVIVGSTTPANAIRRYTTDGTEPNTTSPIFSNDTPIPVTLGNVTTINVKAYMDDWTPSVTQTAVYNVTGQVLMTAPFFSPSPDMYTTPIEVSINTLTSPAGATVRYTIDGSDPNETSTPYTVPIQVAANQSITIRARAFEDGWLPSVINTGVYNVTGQVQITGTVFMPDPAVIYTTAQNVIISTNTNTLGAVVRYTTDGNEPGETSSVYDLPIPLGLNTVTEIKVKAFKTGWTSSPTYSAIYTITGQVNIAGVAITPVSGTYQTSQTVTTTGSLVPNDAVLRYTTDGTDPIASSPLFTPLTPQLNSTLNLKLRGFKDNWTPSAVISASYAFTGQVVLSTPMFTPGAGTYSTATSVTLNNVTVPAGATLRYTLNGVDPTLSSPAYTAAISLPMNASTTLKVRGFLTGWTESAVLSAVYNMTGSLDIAAPRFAPVEGTYTSAQSVSLGNSIILGTATPATGATIRYTTDGNDPTATSTVYNPAVPIAITTTTILKIKSFQTDWIPSPTYTANYEITGQVSLAGITLIPDPGIYQTEQVIEVAGTPYPSDADLRYTTDGSDPTVASSMFTQLNPPLGSTLNLKLRGFRTDWDPSPVLSAQYIFTGQVQIQEPVFVTDPSPIYTTAQNVVISTTTNTLGAAIRFTISTDGTEPNDPDETSPIYNQPIALGLNSVTVIKVKAFKTDWIPSPTYMAVYIITGTVDITGITFTPTAGTYTTQQTISTTGSIYPNGAELRYTDDGSNPTETSNLFTEFTHTLMNSSLNLKFRGFKANWTPSPVVSVNYLFTGQVVLSTPLFTPAAGTYTTQQSITVLPAQLPASGVTIRYTTNGTEPTANSPAYEEPIELAMARTTEVRLKGFADGWTPSVTASAIYIMTGTVATPIFSHPGNVTYGAGFKMGISCATPGATIRYTTDGSDVTSTSLVYGDSLSIGGLTHTWPFKAKAFKEDWIDSAQNSVVYTLLPSPISIWTEIFDTHIRVLWQLHSKNRDLIGFNVYRKRATDSTFPSTPLNAAPVMDMIGGDYYFDDYAIENNVQYHYQVTAVYPDGESPPSSTGSGQLTSPNLIISETSLAFPNPAETSATIRVVLTKSDNVQVAISIYDFAGKKIRTLSKANPNTNKVEIVWDLKNSTGKKVARGTYFANVVVSDSTSKHEKVIKIAVK